VLLLGDARLLPVPATAYRDGVSWAIVDDGAPDARDRWAPPTNEAQALVTTALDEMASASTVRAGRLLAPLGIRFIVVPEFDGVTSTVSDPLPLPTGLVESLEGQLDLVARIPRLATLEVFENRAWLPTSALLQGAAAEATEAAGRETLVRSDLSDATPVFVGVDQFDVAVDDLDTGVVHVAVPFDDRWRLSVDGEDVPARRAFGETTAFDVETGGSGRLQYDSPPTRLLLVFVQAMLWVVALAVVSRVQLPTRRAGLVATGETIIDLSAEPLTDRDAVAAVPPPPAGAATGAERVEEVDR